MFLAAKNKAKELIYKLNLLNKKPRAVILLYHSIGHNDKFSTVAPEAFSWQMNYLAENNFEVARIQEILLALQSKKLSQPMVGITFDDGFKDNYLNAFPALQRHKFPATIFINSSNIGKTIKTKEGIELDIMNESEIKELASSGLIDIESHSHNHYRLSELDEEGVENEVSQSKRLISGLINKPVSVFAYPHGDYDNEVKKITAKHYKLAFGNKPGCIVSGSDLFAIPRNSIDKGVTKEQFKAIVRIGKKRFKFWKSNPKSQTTSEYNEY